MSGSDVLRLESSTPARADRTAAADEANLVALAKTDRASFEPLYARYAERIYWYAYRRLGDHATAEDAAAQTFAKAVTSLQSCRDDRFRSWLFAIARTTVIDARRTVRLHEPRERAEMVPDTGPGPEASVLETEAIDRVRRLLAQLPPRQRHIVELRLAGLTGTEIARVLGCSQVSVRVSQFRAYDRLRRILAAEGPDREGAEHETL